MREGAVRARRLALATVAIIALVLPASASGDRTTTEPTLTIERDCEAFPGLNSADVILTGFPPFTSFEATLEFPIGNGIGPVELTTDASGSFHSDSVGEIGVGEVGVWTATIVWAGGTLTSSLFVDCSQPDEPTSKDQCKTRGWRDFDFKNQGQCVALVQRGPK
jgi:hypothetical protein